MIMKMNNYTTASAILEMHGCMNVVIEKAIPGMPEKCRMKKNGDCTILLGEVSSEVGEIVVASHEVGHFLTYSEGKTNPFKLKKWNLYSGVGFAALFLPAFGFITLDYMVTNILFLLLMLGSLFPLLKYWSMYQEDEVLAERRGLKELYSLQEKYNISFDMVTIESIVDFRIRRHIVGYVKFMKCLFLVTPLLSVIVKLLIS